MCAKKIHSDKNKWLKLDTNKSQWTINHKQKHYSISHTAKSIILQALYQMVLWASIFCYFSVKLFLLHTGWRLGIHPVQVTSPSHKHKHTIHSHIHTKDDFHQPKHVCSHTQISLYSHSHPIVHCLCYRKVPFVRPCPFSVTISKPGRTDWHLFTELDTR